LGRVGSRTASFYRVDVRDSEAVEEVINGVVRDFGSVDVLICSAGVADNIAAEGKSHFLCAYRAGSKSELTDRAQITLPTDLSE
jgi:NAD(P)-dependent dehydrogenase (short-subunit alcohol dehydrogenase family)